MNSNLIPLCHAWEAALNQVLRGKSERVRLLVASVLAGGHVLIEDVPGTGKTTLARALAKAMGAQFRRIQFTPDLMPSDVTGGPIWDAATSLFRIVQGPVFAQVLLADEINRASPRTQSALLEAMEERQVTLDGNAFALPQPFVVLATQNPVEFHGVFPLPEAQLDRFLVRMDLGYPDEATEQEVALLGRASDLEVAQCPGLDPGSVVRMQGEVRQISVAPELLAYAVSLVRATREHPLVRLGASPRAGQALIALARALAYLDGRTHIMPEDIAQSFLPVMAHRIVARENRSRETAEAVLFEVRKGVSVPR